MKHSDSAIIRYLAESIPCAVVAVTLVGCVSDRAVEFRGEGFGAWRYPVRAANFPVDDVSSGELPDQKYVWLGKWARPDSTCGLLLIYPNRSYKHVIKLTAGQPLTEAWWLWGPPNDCRDFARLTREERAATRSALKLSGYYSLRWRGTNDFRVEVDLRSDQATKVVVHGEFYSMHKYHPAQCWVIFYALFGIPFRESRHSWPMIF